MASKKQTAISGARRIRITSKRTSSDEYDPSMYPSSDTSEDEVLQSQLITPEHNESSLQNEACASEMNQVLPTKKKRNFSCIYCLERSNNITELKKHEASCQGIKKIRSENHLLKCKFCNSFFNNKMDLNRHTTMTHITTAMALYNNTKNQHLPCKYCHETYFTQRGLDSHIAKKHIAFEYGKEPRMVIASVPGEFHYPRVQKSLNPSMDYEQKQIINLKAEFALKKNIFHEDSKKFLIHCINCTKDFLETTFFDIHLSKCLKNTVFQCSFCGKLKSSIDEDIFRHIMKHFYKHSGYCEPCDIHFVNHYNENCHKEKFHKQVESEPNDLDIDNQEIESVILENGFLNTVSSFASKMKVRPVSELMEIEPESTAALAHFISGRTENLNREYSDSFLKPSEKGRQNIYTRIACAVAIPSSTDQNEVVKAIKDLKIEIALTKYAILGNSIRIFCTKCKANFLVVDYIDHIKSCFEPGVSKCVFCSIVADIKSTQDFVKHVKIHLFHHFKLLDCSACKSSYLNHFNYKSHSFHFHGIMAPNQQSGDQST